MKTEAYYIINSFNRTCAHHIRAQYFSLSKPPKQILLNYRNGILSTYNSEKDSNFHRYLKSPTAGKEKLADYDSLLIDFYLVVHMWH